ncbi:MAG: GreA/GreB family elongation factor [Candidatus Pacebacteria bacterium]|nr:GreA/GreB family elongation factor [Candidatus Paceibacterota bacterium]
MITKKGLEKLKNEVKELKKQRKEIKERIKRAAAYGDLKENSEYHEVKEAQGFLEGKILKLENLIKNAKVTENISKNIIQIGSVIKTDKEKIEIVDSLEADPLNWKISAESPLGQCFLGKKRGDSVVFQSQKYKIIDIL